MTDFQITIQIVAASVMAIMSIAMFYLSVRLYKNSIQMNELHNQDIKIALWDKRWTIYDQIARWPSKLQRFIRYDNISTDLPNDFKHDIDDLNIKGLAISIRQAQMIYAKDQTIVDFLEEFMKKIVPIYMWCEDHSYDVRQIIPDMKKLRSWYDKTFPFDMQYKFESFMHLDV